MSKIIGLITARGGSKGIPRKNIHPLAGKPLIAWTIEAALQSKVLDRVIVSTDDEEIARVSRDWGAEVPFMRPTELAQDDSPHIPVIKNTVEWLESNENSRPEYILLLQPTTPLRSAQDIDNAYRLILEKDADSVISVCEAFSHPYLTKHITAEGRLEDFGPRPDGYLARQVLPPVYIVNGAIYFIRCDVLLKENTLYTQSTYAYLMPQERSLDIDTPWDLHLAELILKDREKHESD